MLPSTIATSLRLPMPAAGIGICISCEDRRRRASASEASVGIRHADTCHGQIGRGSIEPRRLVAM